MMGKDALFETDAGQRNLPGTDSPWEHWVSASRTRNCCNNDPLLDWLHEHGHDKGYLRDDEQPGYDERTDFLKIVFEKGQQFETAVFAHLDAAFDMVEIAEDHRAARDEAAATATWEAMTAGREIIGQAVLWNPERQTYGMPDLLVRSDVLHRIVPDSIDADEAVEPAADIPGAAWHYRVVDVKFSTLSLLASGTAGAKHLPFMVQVWVYNEALGRIQGYQPSSGYLLGRGWEQRGQRGKNALQRLARVEQAQAVRGRGSLEDLARASTAWIRDVRQSGARWQVSPAPSVVQLWPNMKSNEDAPWHTAKAEIAAALKDLTVLPGVNAARRDDAVANGITSWDDVNCSAATLGVTGPATAGKLDRVLQANHSLDIGPIVFPASITAGEARWRHPAPVEFFVDFETVNSIDDDFSTFPDQGGQPLIFMIGCGHVVEGEWRFSVFTADLLEEHCEVEIIRAWLDHVKEVCAEHCTTIEDSRFFHWSHAEVSMLTGAYNSAAARHGLPEWNALPWMDLLVEVFRAEPVGVRGAFGYGLKAIAKSMHGAGLIETVWGDGSIDGLGAMVAGWWCDHEARDGDCRMVDLELMQEVEAYNEVDCRVMWEILDWLRGSR